MKANIVSIITPLYNAEKYIAETISSVLAQTYQNWEMIIVDDCSTDSGSAIVTTYCEKDIRIRFLQLPKNVGPAEARNKAIERAKGRYIAFLDADDLWLPQKLEKQLHIMHEMECDIVCGSYFILKKSGKYIEFNTHKKTITYKDMLYKNYFSCLVTIYDTKNIGKHYFRRDDLLFAEDYALWLDMVKKGCKVFFFQDTLAIYRITTKSRSSNKYKEIHKLWNIFRKFENMSYIKSLYYMFCYIVQWVIKYYMSSTKKPFG